MIVEEFTAQWNNAKPQVAAHWRQLTLADIDEIEGNVERFTQRVAERYGHSEDEAKAGILEWIEHLDQIKAIID